MSAHRNDHNVRYLAINLENGNVRLFRHKRNLNRHPEYTFIRKIYKLRIKTVKAFNITPIKVEPPKFNIPIEKHYFIDPNNRTFNDQLLTRA